jgi:alpha-glucosidase
LENNSILLNLNDSCALVDTSWIKPGKVIREVTLTTVGGKACVDFAVKYGLQYVLFDAGWYGRERDPKSDARCVSVGTSLDLPEVIGYGKERGIGVILYVNHIAAERQLDEILPLYRKWGVKGVKYGFVNVGAQQWTSWLHMAIRKAAENQLMVDVHDEYRPTGYTRTYPNLMTVEGIGGDEVSDRTNEQSIIAQFTRFLAGPADNTICYYNKRVDRLASHAYQLAKAVCFYSPWQHLFWYDRPSDAHDEPELEFFKSVPTVWDETKVLDGRIGTSSVIARRSGDEWFIGAMNSGQPRAFDVPLDFLDACKKYIAHIYTDDPSVPTRTHVRVERQPVRQDSVLSVRLSAQGGQAIRIAPE